MIKHIKYRFYFLMLITVSCSFTSCNNNYEMNLCSKYEEYYKDRTFSMTTQDSIDSFKYFNQKKEWATNAGKAYGGNPYSFTNNYIIKYRDTSFLNKIIKDYYFFPKKFKENVGLDYSLVNRFIENEAVIFGKVVAKDDYSDSCLFYTTTYTIRVDSVLHSYFSLEINDIVLLKTNGSGHVGGCGKENKQKYYFTSSHEYVYQVNESDYFFLNRTTYLRQYEVFIKNNKRYFDPYCYNSFINRGSFRLSGLIQNSDKNKLSKFIKLIKVSNN